ncbi:MAG: hypothetical protein MJ252_04270 [archaeon]|nr:hypothetical protein [archaeon]
MNKDQSATGEDENLEKTVLDISASKANESTSKMENSKSSEMSQSNISKNKGIDAKEEEKSNQIKRKGILSKEDKEHKETVDDLKKQIRKLVMELSDIRESLVTVEDYESLIEDTEHLIMQCEENKAKINRPTRIINRDSLNPVSGCVKQMQYIKGLNLTSPNTMNKYLSSLDPDLHPKYKNKEKQKGCLEFAGAVPGVKTLVERVNSELQIQQSEYTKSEINIKSQRAKAKSDETSLENQINLYRAAIELAKDKIRLLRMDNVEKETETIKEKCLEEYGNFSKNLLVNLTTKNVQDTMIINPTLSDLTQLSTDNLMDLNEVIRGLKLRKNSEGLGVSLVEMFKTNIFLSYQNNDLNSFILKNLVDFVDEKIFETISPECKKELSNKMKKIWKKLIKNNPSLYE